ncbi:unnamed protein product, partial [Mesorhabditis spiculigera]
MASNVGAGLTTTTSLDDYDDFEERFVDPFEITSSCVFVVLGALTICIYYRIARAHARQGFRTHFQRIFFVLITNDIFTFLFQLFDVRLPTWGVHEWYLDLREGLWPTILNYGATVTLMVQSFGTLLIALNRFTSLVMPLRYERLWKRVTYPCCVAVVVIPCVLSINCLFVRSEFIRLSWGYYIPNTNISVGT